ncbi:hypothetical protein PFISCL1PPCAC_2296, partial [Pristionchus fissidentatus]
HTPPSMFSRKICLLNLLFGCFLLSLFYGLSQPLPIFPFRVRIFTGPLRSLGSTVASIQYALWFSDMTFIGNGCSIASLSHYLDLTNGSQNRIFRYLRRISLTKRILLFKYIHFQNFIVSMATVALIYIDFDVSQIIYDFYQPNFSTYQIKCQSNKIKPSISPRTWEILHHTSRLFLAIAIQPLFSFFIP